MILLLLRLIIFSTVTLSIASLKNALKDQFPEEDWNEVFRVPQSRSRPIKRASSVGSTTDVDIAALKTTFESIALRFGFQDLNGWYSVDKTQINTDEELQTALQPFGGYLASALPAVYPNHPWQEWRLGIVPRNFWSNKANRVRLLKAIVPGSLEDWYTSSDRLLKLLAELVF